MGKTAIQQIGENMLQEEVSVQHPQSTGQGSYPQMVANMQLKADILDKIRPDALVEELRHKLMGEKWDNGKWVINQATKDRALTAIGAEEITNLMLPVSSINASLCDLKSSEINKRTISIVDTAMDMCLANWKRYGIKTRDQFSFVYEIVFSNTFVSLKQPENNGLKRWLQGIMEQRTVSTVSNTEQKKGGAIAALFGG